MPKKQTNTTYPQTMFVHTTVPDNFLANNDPGVIMDLQDLDDGAEIAIYKFDRLAKVKRTVTVE